MEIIDEIERKKKQRQKEATGFCCAFKLGFVQLICRASLIFKSNLELALSIILKERELDDSKHVVVEYRCLKICDLLSFLIGSQIDLYTGLLLNFKSFTSFSYKISLRIL